MRSLIIPSMLLRLCFVVALVLGVLFWTGHADSLTRLHEALGIVLVASLLWIAVANIVVAHGGLPLSILAVIFAAALTVIGFTQDSILTSGPHWVIQIVHLVLALIAIGLGEAIVSRGQRKLAAQAA